MFIGRTDAGASILWPFLLRANSLEKIVMLGKIEGKRRRGWQRMRWLDIVTDSMDMNLSKLQEIAEDKGAWSMGLQRVGHNSVTEQQHKSTVKGLPLVVHWLRLCAFNTGVLDFRFLVRELDPTCPKSWCKKINFFFKKIYSKDFHFSADILNTFKSTHPKMHYRS